MAISVGFARRFSRSANDYCNLQASIDPSWGARQSSGALVSANARRYHGAMHTLFDILIPVSLAAVVLVLFIGIYALFRGGDFGRSYSNKLMRLRVLLQAIAIAILVAAFWWNRHGR